MLNKVLLTALATCLVSTSFANPTHPSFGQIIISDALITKPSALNITGQRTKPVVLMNVNLTPAQKKLILNFEDNTSHIEALAGEKLPSFSDVGMNGVPVLDQGMHGTCVTFAATAALNAIMDKGDYISQLCSLQLGSYLEQRSYAPSGWDGSYGNIVLDQFKRFGIVSKSKQATEGCAGVKEYPANDMNYQGNPMSLKEYKALSENLDYNFQTREYFSIIDPFLRMSANDNQAQAKNNLLRLIKRTLAKPVDDIQQRIIFGTILLQADGGCNVGACATYHNTNDTWALTKAIKKKKEILGGHEMIIIGYDDNAIATDNEGKKHKGLLKLRNSWGDDVGDQGDFYMTYDYFKRLVMNVDNVVYLQNEDK
jgi:hypothetical protein